MIGDNIKRYQIYVTLFPDSEKPVHILWDEGLYDTFDRALSDAQELLDLFYGVNVRFFAHDMSIPLLVFPKVGSKAEFEQSRPQPRRPVALIPHSLWNPGSEPMRNFVGEIVEEYKEVPYAELDEDYVYQSELPSDDDLPSTDLSILSGEGEAQDNGDVEEEKKEEPSEQLTDEEIGAFLEDFLKPPQEED